jgi:hypothetical protein
MADEKGALSLFEEWETISRQVQVWNYYLLLHLPATFPRHRLGR